MKNKSLTTFVASLLTIFSVAAHAASYGFHVPVKGLKAALPLVPGTLSPNSLTFAPQGVGSTSSAQTLTITNPNTSALAVGTPSISQDTSSFSISGNTCGTSLAANASCVIAINVMPTAPGALSGTFSILVGSTTLTANLSGSGSGAYARWSATDKGKDIAVSSDGLTIQNTNVSGTWSSVRADIGKSSGKWYWETRLTQNGGTATAFGVASSNAIVENNYPSSNNPAGWIINSYGVFSGGLASQYNTAASLKETDTVSIAMDMDAKVLFVAVNGSWLNNGNPVATGLPATNMYPILTQYGPNSPKAVTNFGAISFKYTPPAGYSGLSK